ALLDVRDWPLARLDAFEEVLHVRPDRGRDVPFEVLFGAIFRVLIQLVDDGFRDRRLLLAGFGEGVPHDARLERPLVAEEHRAPGEPRPGGIAPRAMRPDDAQVWKLERRLLGVGDVGFAVLVDEDAAGRRDP